MSGFQKLFGSVEWMLAKRLLWGRKRNYVSLVSAVSLWGLAIGVASLAVILAVSGGFESAFRDRLLGVYPHLIVIGKGGQVNQWLELRQQLSTLPELSSVEPATYDEMMASHRSRRAGAVVKGIDVSVSGSAGGLRQFLVDGSFDGLDPVPTPSAVYDRETETALVSLGDLPGGAAGLLYLSGEADSLRAQWFPLVHEATQGFMVFAVGNSRRLIETGGVLQESEFTLEPWTLAGPFTNVEPVTIQMTVDGVELSAKVADAQIPLAVITGGEEQPLLLVCELPPPSSSTAEFSVCVVNESGIEARLVDAQSGDAPVPKGMAVTRKLRSTVVPGVVLGRELARQIEAVPGDEIRLVSPLTTMPGVTRSGRSQRPIVDTFVVKGIIDVGFYEYDSRLAVIGFETARRFLHQGDTARWIELRVADLFGSDVARKEVSRTLSSFSLLSIQDHLPGLAARMNRFASVQQAPKTAIDHFDNVHNVLEEARYSDFEGSLSLGLDDEYRVITWQEMNEPLFTSLKRQKIILALFFMIIIVIAGFSVVSSQAMIIREKTREISILKALGATFGQVRRAFLIQGMAIGILGVGLGLLLSFLICGFLEVVGFPLDPKVYFVSELPVDLNWSTLLWASGLALALVFGAISVASRMAASKTPIDGLRQID